MKQHRISIKYLETVISNINYLTKHEVKLFVTQGCGVHLIIDGVEYNKQISENEFTGISNKQAMELLKPYNDEAREEGLKRYCNK